MSHGIWRRVIIIFRDFKFLKFFNFIFKLPFARDCIIRICIFERKVTSIAKLLTSRNHAPVYGVATAIFLSLARQRRDRRWKARCVEPRR